MPRLDYTVPEDCSPTYADPDGKLIDIDVVFPHTGRVRYTASESDPGYEHSEEIYQRAAAEEFGAVAPYVAPQPMPDYVAFWDALVVSSAYHAIREQSFASLPMNTLVTEFIALLGDAKAGRPNEAAIQQSMNAILTVGVFTEEQLAELQAALVAGNIDTLYSLTDPDA